MTKKLAFQMLDEEGNTFTVSLNRVKELLGLKVLESRVFRLEQPRRTQRILQLLEEEGKPKSFTWLSRFAHPFYQEDVWKLIKEGKLKPFLSGSHHMLQLVEP